MGMKLPPKMVEKIDAAAGASKLQGKPQMSMWLDLPFPPALNNLYVNAPDVGRVLGKRGKAYKKAVALACRGQGHLTGRLQVWMYAYPPDARKRDIDGLIKAPLDSLQAAGIFEDDSQVDKLVIYRCEIVKHGKLSVNIIGEWST